MSIFYFLYDSSAGRIVQNLRAISANEFYVGPDQSADGILLNHVKRGRFCGENGSGGGRGASIQK